MLHTFSISVVLVTRLFIFIQRIADVSGFSWARYLSCRICLNRVYNKRQEFSLHLKILFSNVLETFLPLPLKVSFSKSASTTFRISCAKQFYLLFRALLFSFTFLTAATADKYFSSIVSFTAVFMAVNTGTSLSRSMTKIEIFIEDANVTKSDLQQGPLKEKRIGNLKSRI